MRIGGIENGPSAHGKGGPATHVRRGGAGRNPNLVPAAPVQRRPPASHLLLTCSLRRLFSAPAPAVLPPTAPSLHAACLSFPCRCAVQHAAFVFFAWLCYMQLREWKREKKNSTLHAGDSLCWKLPAAAGWAAEEEKGRKEGREKKKKGGREGFYGILWSASCISR